MTMPNPFSLPELMATLALDTNSNPVVTASVLGHLSCRGLFCGGHAPAIAAVAGVASANAISAHLRFHLCASFICTPAGTPAADLIATVTFGTALSAAPACNLLNGWDQTAATPAGGSLGATSISKT